jgi:uncharacterized membrane protein (Fun14 family)
VIEVLILLVVCGVVWYLVTTYVPMPQPIKVVITVVAVLALCIWLLQYFGVTDFDFRHHRH